MFSKVKTTTQSPNGFILFIFLILVNSVLGNPFYFDEPRRPAQLVAQVGSYVVFNCPLEFPQDFPIPYNLHWKRDGNSVFSWYDGALATSSDYVGRINLVDNNDNYGKGSVNLTSIRETDEGWYECKVIFPNRTPNSRNNGTWFHLSVDGGVLLKIPPINQTIMEGQTAFFQCAPKWPETSNVTWWKDGIMLTDLHDLSHRSIIGPDGSLTIDPTVMSDLGEYECVIHGDEDIKQSARAFLNIQYKAKVLYSPKEIYLPYGAPALLDCHFRSNPPLTNLRWEKDGFLFDPYNVQGVFYKRNGSLYFSKVDESHAGRYSCTPYNDLGTEGSSPLINVFVQLPPVFTIRPSSIYIHKLGDTVEMVCDAKDRDGDHRPEITWNRKDGQPIPRERYSRDGGNITIENITEEDRGIYQCAAINKAAKIIAETELMIENVPARPPYNLTANSTETAITIQWQPGIIRHNLEYAVWYRLSNSAEWRTMRILTRNKMEGTITNLEPGREYEFMVLSQDRYGDGMFSKTYRYYTKHREFKDPAEYKDPIMPFAQIGPPRNVTVEIINDGYLITWEPPEYGQDQLRLYIARWWQEPGHFLHGSTETRETNYLVKQLNEDELYTFQVYSLSTSDYEAGSNVYEFFVPPYRRMKAIAIGVTTGLLFLMAAAAVFLYVKKKWFKGYKTNDINNEKK